MTVCIEVHRVAGRTGAHSDMIDNLNNMRVAECQARPGQIYTLQLALYPQAPVHAGKPGMQKSEKIIFLNKAYNVRVTMDKVRAWLHLEGKIIKSWKISQKSWKNDPPHP